MCTQKKEEKKGKVRVGRPAGQVLLSAIVEYFIGPVIARPDPACLRTPVMGFSGSLNGRRLFKIISYTGRAAGPGRSLTLPAHRRRHWRVPLASSPPHPSRSRSSLRIPRGPFIPSSALNSNGSS